MSSAVPEARPPGQHWLFRRSFRAQVTAWNTFTILIFTVTILLGLRYGLFLTLLQEEDNLLVEDAAEVGLFVDRYAPNWGQLDEELERKAQGHAPRKWFGLIRQENGQVLAQSDSLPDVELPITSHGSPRTQSIGSYRMTLRSHTVKNGTNYLILVGATTDEIEEDVARLTRLLVLAGILLLIFAPLGGFWLAGRVIRPLANIIATTANLRPSNLRERLPLRGTDDELDQLSRTFNGLLDRIADYLAHHRDLVANAAHELRSPLTAIRSSTEVALNQERSPEEYKDLLGVIVEECTRLGTLVQQLLLLAESDAGRLERTRQRVALDVLVKRAVDMFQGVAETKGVTLQAVAPQPVWALGDAGLFQQVIFNLIDNALKFTAQGFIRVEIKIDDNGNGVLSVADSGAGIPPKSLPYVFDRFYRGDHGRTRSATSGSGLGLSICQALVTSAGGDITIRSEVGRGTEVQVTLPAEP